MIRPRIVTLSQTYEKSSHAMVCATASVPSSPVEDDRHFRIDPPRRLLATDSSPTQQTGRPRSVSPVRLLGCTRSMRARVRRIVAAFDWAGGVAGTEDTAAIGACVLARRRRPANEPKRPSPRRRTRCPAQAREGASAAHMPARSRKQVSKNDRLVLACSSNSGACSGFARTSALTPVWRCRHQNRSDRRHLGRACNTARLSKCFHLEMR
jgi:hypothetical protein